MYAFVHFLPSNSVDECNEIVNSIFDNIFNYVQAHYLTKKEDTSFWKEVKYDLKITPSLQKLLDKWKKRFPLAQDIHCRWGMFSEINYIPILYGLKWFDQEVVFEQYKNISHLPVIDWNDTIRKDVLYMGHKQFIYNLNKKT